jgi:hypothetical protein
VVHQVGSLPEIFARCTGNKTLKNIFRHFKCMKSLKLLKGDDIHMLSTKKWKGTSLFLAEFRGKYLSLSIWKRCAWLPVYRLLLGHVCWEPYHLAVGSLSYTQDNGLPRETQLSQCSHAKKGCLMSVCRATRIYLWCKSCSRWGKSS